MKFCNIFLKNYKKYNSFINNYNLHNCIKKYNLFFNNIFKNKYITKLFFLT